VVPTSQVRAFQHVTTDFMKFKRVRGLGGIQCYNVRTKCNENR